MGFYVLPAFRPQPLRRLEPHQRTYKISSVIGGSVIFRPGRSALESFEVAAIAMRGHLIGVKWKVFEYELVEEDTK
jgi:hypothetical protein